LSLFKNKQTKNSVPARYLQLTPVILASWEADIRMITV
jgi:hypothetical protein